VAPVRREHVVVGAQRGAHTDGHRFLADGDVQESRNTASGEELPCPLFEHAHAQHAGIHLEQEIGAGDRHSAADYSTGLSLTRRTAHPSSRRSRTDSAA
jgi:hypothetical protein